MAVACGQKLQYGKIDCLQFASQPPGLEVTYFRMSIPGRWTRGRRLGALPFCQRAGRLKAAFQNITRARVKQEEGLEA